MHLEPAGKAGRRKSNTRPGAGALPANSSMVFISNASVPGPVL